MPPADSVLLAGMQGRLEYVLQTLGGGALLAPRVDPRHIGAEAQPYRGRGVPMGVGPGGALMKEMEHGNHLNAERFGDQA